MSAIRRNSIRHGERLVTNDNPSVTISRRAFLGACELNDGALRPHSSPNKTESIMSHMSEILKGIIFFSIVLFFIKAFVA